MKRFIARIAPIAFVTLASVGIYACTDSTGPNDDGGNTATITVQPVFPSSAASVVHFTRAHVIVRRSDGSVALDTTVNYTANTAAAAAAQAANASEPLAQSTSNTPGLQFEVPISRVAGPNGETFTVEFDLLDAAGNIVFHGGPTSVHGDPDTPSHADVSTAYTGVGSNAVRVEITPTSSSANTGANVDFVAKAFTASNIEVPGTPVQFISVTPTLATVPNEAVGRAVMGSTRGTARIRAILVTGQTADALVNITALPTTLIVQSGNNQSLAVNSAAQPLVVKVTAADGLGVSGVGVNFTIQSGGGALAAAQATTDADGLASVGYTFGQTPGAVTILATVNGLSGSPATFSLTGTASAVTQVVFVSQPTNALVGSSIGTVTIEARDQFGNRVTTFTGQVNVALEAPPAGVLLNGTATVNAVAGVATFNGLTVSAPGNSLRLRASATALPTVLSTAFTISPRPPTALVFTTQPPATIPAGDLFPVTIQVRDDLGNLVSGFTGNVSVALVSPPAGVTLGGATTVAAVAGVASFTNLNVSAPAVGLRLTATAVGVTGTATSNLFTVGAPTNPLQAAPTSTSFTVQRTAPSPSAAVVNLTSPDAPITGLAVGPIAYGPGATGWLVAGLGGATTPTTLTLTPTSGTLPEGTFSADVPITGAGGISLVYSVVITVTPLPATQLVVITEPGGAITGFPFTTQPVVEIRDATGTRILSAANTVTVSINTGPGVLAGTLTRTPNQGRVSFTDLRITGIGAHTLAFASAGLTGTNSASFTVAPTPPTQMALNAGNNQTVIAGSAVPTLPSVIVRDVNNNPVTGVAVTFAVATGGGSITGGAAVTNASGIATVGSWTLGTAAGPNTLTATVAGLTGSPVTFNATGTAGPATQIAINAGNGQAATVNTSVAVAPSVVVRDVNNNPVAGVAVTFAVATGGGSITGAAGVTNASGIATVGSWTLGTIAGSNTLTATSAGLAGSPLTFTATGIAGAGTIAINAGNTQTAVAGTAVAIPPSVIVRDGFNNPIAGINVTFAVATGGGSVTGGTATTNASGVATVGSWTLGTTAGANSMTATSPGLAGSPLTFTATGTAGPATQIAINAGNGQSATVTAAVAVPPSVIVRDVNNNPVAGVSVTFAVATGGGAVVGGAATTNAAGIASVTSWSVGATIGANTLTATSAGLTGSPLTFTATATAGPATTIALNAGNAQTATVNTAVAIAPSVLVTDAGGNPKAGVNVTFAVASGGGSVVGGAAVTNASGIATVTSWTLGTTVGANSLTATSAGLTGSPVTFTATGTAGAATQIAISTGNGQTATVNTAVAIAPAAIVRDAFNNVVAGVNVTFAVATGGGAVVGGAATTNAAGIAAVTSWTLGTTAGANTLTATSAGLTGSPLTYTATGTAGAATQVAINAGDGQAATVNTAVATPPSVIVRDAFNNPKSGVSVTFAVATGGGSATGTAATTNAAGIATVGSWTLGTIAGTNTLTATSAGLAGSPVTFTATGIAGAGTIAINAGNAQTATVGTAVAVQPSVIVRDGFNNPIAGINVTFAVATGGGSVTGGAAVTNGAGIATVGSWTLGNTASANSLTASSPGLGGSPVTFTATGTAGAATQIAINAGNNQTTTVAGAVAIPPSVVVRDVFNNPVAGVGVTFAVATGGGNVVGGAATTNASGIATVTSWTLGNSSGTNNNTLTATSAGLTGSPLTFTASASAGPATTIALNAGNAQTATVNTAVAIAPSVLVTDAGGNPKAGVSVTFAVASGGGSVVGGSAVTNASGIATVTSWTLGTTAGANSLTATSAGLAGSPVTFTATGTAGAATQISISAGNGQTATVNTAVAVAPAALVRDAFSNVVAGVSVTFAVATGGGSVVGGAATTNASGIAAVTSWTLGTTAGANSLTATSAGLTGSPLTYTATGTAGAATQIAINAGDGQAATVNTAVATPPSVIVRDAFNNPKSGVSVTFAVATGGGSATGTAATTNAAGIATVGSWTLGTIAGTNTLTATSAGLAGSPVTFTATGIAGAGTIAINGGNNQSAISGNAVATAPSVIVRDGFNNPISGINVTFAVATGGGSVTGAVATTNGAGIATVGSWTLGLVGINTMTATSAGLTGSPVTFTATATAGPPSQIAINAGNNQTQTVNAAVPIAPSVLVRDAGNNPVAGVSVTFAVATGGGSVVGGAATTNASGIATLTSWTLGTTAGTNNNTITATSAGLTGSPLTFTASATAGAATQIAINAGNNQTATVGTAVAVPPSVLVRDAFNNPKSGVSVTFAVASGAGVVSGGSATTNASGIATVTSWTLGTTAGTNNNTLSATSAGLTGSPLTFTASATAGAATQLLISAGNGQSAAAGSAVATAPAALVRDAFNNPVSGVNVTFAVATGGGSITGGPVIATNASGIAALTSWTLGTTAGANSLTATSAGLTGSPLTFTATGTAGAATQIAINAGNNQTATVNAAVAVAPSVIVRDVNNNPVAGVSVTFAVTGGGGTLGAPLTVTTNASGIATIASWTLGTVAGTNNNTISATSAGLTGSPLTFTASATAGNATQISISAGNNQSAQISTAVATAPAVLVRDAFNNPKAGINVTFAVTSGGGTLGAPLTVATNASGIATIASWTLGSTVGTNNNTISATSAGLTGSPLTFTASATAGPATQISINAGNNQTATVNTAVGTAPSVLVRDAGNNPVAGVSVTFAVATGGGSVVGGAATTNASGIATVTSWTLGTVSGTNNNTLTATSAGLTGSPLTFTASATAGNATQIAINAGNNQTSTVNTAVATAPSVLVRDVFNNPKSGVSVTFAVATGGGSVVGGAATTNASGIATVTSWTLGTSAGTNNNTLTATSAGLTGSPLTFTASATAGAATQISINGGNNQSATAGTAVPVAPSVLVRDAFNNPVNAVSVTFAAATGGGSVTGGAATTNASGIATVGSWTLGGAAGPNTMTATSAGLTGSPLTFNATGAAALSTTLAIPTITLQAGTNFVAAAPVTASGGTPAYTFTLTGGTLPTGMNFNTTNGQLSGTPTSILTTTAFTVTVTDAGGSTPSAKTFNLTVNAILLNVSAAPTATIGLAASAACTAGVEGTCLAVPINIDMTNRGTDNMSSLQITVTWDPTRFQFVSESVGNGAGWTVIPNTTNVGTGTVTLGGFAATGTTTNFTFHNLTFKPLTSAGGPAVITATVNAAATDLGANIVVPVRNLTVTINP